MFYVKSLFHGFDQSRNTLIGDNRDIPGAWLSCVVPDTNPHPTL